MLVLGAVRHHALLLLLLLSATATRTTMSMPLPLLLLLLSLLLPPPPLLLPCLLLLLHLAQPRHAVVAAVFERVEVDVGAEGQEADHQAVDQLSGRARGLEEDGQARDRQLRSGSRCAALVRRRDSDGRRAVGPYPRHVLEGEGRAFRPHSKISNHHARSS